MLGSLTRFESDVLEKLLHGNGSTLEILRMQLENATATKQYTGAGFYVDFEIPHECTILPISKCRFGDVVAEIDGLEYGAGFVILIVDGRLSQLEGYSYEEPWPNEISRYTLKYSSEPRNLPFETNANITM